MRGTLPVRCEPVPLHRDEARGREPPAVGGHARTPRRTRGTRELRVRGAHLRVGPRPEERERPARQGTRPGRAAERPGPVARPGELALHGEAAAVGVSEALPTRKPGAPMRRGPSRAARPRVGPTRGPRNVSRGGRTSRRAPRAQGSQGRQPACVIQEAGNDRTPERRRRARARRARERHRGRGRAGTPTPPAPPPARAPNPPAPARARARALRVAPRAAAQTLPEVAPRRLPRALRDPVVPTWMYTTDRAAPPGRWPPAATSGRAMPISPVAARSSIAARRWSRARRRARSRRTRRVAVPPHTTSSDPDQEPSLHPARHSTTALSARTDRRVDHLLARRRLRRRHPKKPPTRAVRASPALLLTWPSRPRRPRRHPPRGHPPRGHPPPGHPPRSQLPRSQLPLRRRKTPIPSCSQRPRTLRGTPRLPTVGAMLPLERRSRRRKTPRPRGMRRWEPAPSSAPSPHFWSRRRSFSSVGWCSPVPSSRSSLPW